MVNTKLFAPKTGFPATIDQGGRKPLASTANDVRHIAPGDITSVRTTAAEDPLRRMVMANKDWVVDELPQTSASPRNTRNQPHNGTFGPVVFTARNRHTSGYLPDAKE